MRSLATSWTFALVLAMGCADVAPSGPADPPPPPPTERPAPTPGVRPPPDAVADGRVPGDRVIDGNAPGAIGLGPSVGDALLPAPTPPDPLSRPRRRMDLDQLSASFARVTGGLAWTEPRGRAGDVDQFQELASTLGKPDYVEITNETLEASVLFQKFLDDAARSVCDRLVRRELDDPRAESILMAHASLEDTLDEAEPRIERNLISLLTRFHGRVLEPGAPELEPWRWLFASVVHGTNEPSEAWRAVCVALFTHPDFYSF